MQTTTIPLDRLLIRVLRRFLALFMHRRGFGFAYRMLEKILRRIPRAVTCDTFFNVSLRCRTDDDLQRTIILTGCWEPGISLWLVNSLKAGDVFVDVGANIGYDTLLAAKLVGPAGKVVALEPSPAMVDALRQNLAANAVANTRLIEAAAGSGSSLAPLYKAPAHNSGLASLRAGSSTEVESMVKVGRLDELLSNAEMTGARLIKIDVEGFEHEVLRGLDALWPVARADLEFIIELTPSGAPAAATDEIFQRFRARGFLAYDLKNRYRAEDYCPRSRIAAPAPAVLPLDRQTDILFTRRMPPSGAPAVRVKDLFRQWPPEIRTAQTAQGPRSAG